MFECIQRCLSFEKCFNVWKFVLGKCFEMCCGVFLKIARMFCKFDQVTRSCLPYLLKDLSYTFLTLLQCCFTIAFGKQTCIWMLNGIGAGHRIDHDSNSAKYLSKFFVWGTRSSCIGNQDSVIARPWSFVLFLFCKDTQHSYHGHFKGSKWMKP